MNEFGIIQRFFSKSITSRNDVILGIGDDAAIISPPKNHDLIITTDTLVSGVHFPEHTSAFDIGFKSLAANLSDLAAMGATPAWLTLALTLPNANEEWLSEFSRGFFSLADHYQAPLIGGDLTRGPLTITVQAHGLVPTGQAIRRSTAKPGDLIYVTNTLGDAALALAVLQDKIKLSNTDNTLLQKLNRPAPQLKIGEQLRGVASPAIDISDGLLADLGHILEKSHVGARINVDLIPLSTTLLQIEKNQALEFALSDGDDYELCFTVQINEKNRVPDNSTCIGEITDTQQLDLHFNDGVIYPNPQNSGYQHFRH